jgi:hypothetical protein
MTFNGAKPLSHHADEVNTDDDAGHSSTHEASIEAIGIRLLRRELTRDTKEPRMANQKRTTKIRTFK